MSLDDLYRETILDHYKKPRNKRHIDGADIDLEHNNPLCGDEIRILAVVRDGAVQDLAFEGQGCSISQASASMLTEQATGKSLEALEDLILSFRGMMAGKTDVDDDALGDLAALKGVTKYPVRIKCAVLAWDTLQEGVQSYRSSH
jgi:nitrogen fixation NifU-like protein